MSRDSGMGMGGKTRSSSAPSGGGGGLRGGGADSGTIPDSSGNVNQVLAARASEAQRVNALQELLRRQQGDKREELVEVLRARQLNMPRMLPTPLGIGIASLNPFLQRVNTRQRSKFLSNVSPSFYNLNPTAQEQEYQTYLQSLRPEPITGGNDEGIAPILQPEITTLIANPQPTGISNIPMVQDGTFKYGIPFGNV